MSDTTRQLRTWSGAVVSWDTPITAIKVDLGDMPQETPEADLLREAVSALVAEVIRLGNLAQHFADVLHACNITTRFVVVRDEKGRTQSIAEQRF